MKIILVILILVHAGVASGQAENKKVPILCYHHFKETVYENTTYTLLKQSFYDQIKLLHDSGYHTISPDELYNYLTGTGSLPKRPIMLTFDDAHAEHYSLVAPILEEFQFRGVFFVMTVPIGKPGYLTAAQIKLLSDKGHTIGNHTWDHQNMKKLKGVAWAWQISKPKEELERITGKAINYFCYPYGVWTETAIKELKSRGIRAAFQLGGHGSTKFPLYTISRTLIAGDISPAAFRKVVGL